MPAALHLQVSSRLQLPQECRARPTVGHERRAFYVTSDRGTGIDRMAPRGRHIGQHAGRGC
ncbi:MAG TPA: hypothetical protein VIQ62_00980, partial [Burkholderiales bacterium]